MLSFKLDSSTIPKFVTCGQKCTENIILSEKCKFLDLYDVHCESMKYKKKYVQINLIIMAKTFKINKTFFIKLM